MLYGQMRSHIGQGTHIYKKYKGLHQISVLKCCSVVNARERIGNVLHFSLNLRCVRKQCYSS